MIEKASSFLGSIGWIKTLLGGAQTTSMAGMTAASAAGSALGRGAVAVGSAAVGGAGGKYIGDNTTRATWAFILVLIVSIIDFFPPIQFAPGPERTLLHLTALVGLSFLLLDKGSMKGGTIVAVFIITALSNTIYLLMEKVFNIGTGFFYTLDFSSATYTFSMIFDALIRLSVPFILILLLLAILYRKRILEVDNTLVVGFFIAMYVLPLLESSRIATLAKETSGFEAVGVIINLLYIFPIWFLIIQAGGLARPVRGIAWLQNIFFIVLLVIVLLQIIPALLIGYDVNGSGGIDTRALFFETWTASKMLFFDGINATQQAFVNAKNASQRAIDEASGKNFESDVERGARRDVGLNLDPITISPKEIHLDSDVIFGATLAASAFDVPIRANASCYVQSSKADFDPIKGEIAQPQFLIVDDANDEIICRYYRGELRTTGGFTANMDIDFDYAASAYLRRYYTKPGFMEQFRGSRRAPEDLFMTQYGIDLNLKESVRTAGPVDLAITTPSVVTELLESNYDRPTTFLRVGLESVNRGWNGKLSEVHKLILSIPNEFIIKTRVKPGETGSNGLSDLIEHDDFGEVPDCTDGGLDATFEILSDASCNAYGEDVFGLGDLDCINFQHIVITPSKAKADATEKDVVFGCYIQPVDTQSFLQNAAFLPVSFQARLAYKYSLEQSRGFSVKPAEDPNFIASSKSLEVNTVGGVTISSEVPYKHEYSFILSKAKRDLFAEIKAEMEKFPEFTAASPETQQFALAYIYYYWDQLSINKASGKYQIGSKYGPLRVDVQKLDYLVSQGLVDLQPEAQQSSQANGTTTESESSQSNLTTTQSTQTSSTNEPMRTEDKRKVLEEKGFEYGLTYFTHLIAQCNLGNGVDPACVFGKYTCHNDFEWGNYNSCGQSSDTCQACHATIMPKMFTYVKDIACQAQDPTCWAEVSS